MAEAPGAPVFVVGMSRSGTTLLSAMLSAHSRLDCGPESHLLTALRSLDPAARAQLVESAGWPGRATDFIVGLENRGHRSIDAFGLEPEDIAAWLQARPPSLAAMLESLTAQHAERAGKPRWVEKTPRHLLALKAIREAWPEAFVVRIVRDPRDVAVSLAGMPFAADTQAGNLVRIDSDDRRSRRFFESDPRAVTLRYEDLVTDPEQELRRVCDAIGEDFEPGMLDRSASASGVTAEHEWWKASVGGELDASRVGRWRTEMPPDVQRFAALYLVRYLEAHRYEGARKPTARVAVVPIGDGLKARSEELLLGLSAHDLVPLRPSPRRASELRGRQGVVFVGLRGQLDPLRNASARERLRNDLHLALLLLRQRLRRHPVLWIRESTRRDHLARDPGEVLVATLLRLFARTTSTLEAPVLLAGMTGAATATAGPDEAAGV